MRDQIPAPLSTEHSQALEDVGDYKKCLQESGKHLDATGRYANSSIYGQPLVLPHSMHDSRTRFLPSVSRRIDRRVHPQALRPAPSLRRQWSPRAAVGPASAIQTEVPARLSGSAVRSIGTNSPSATWRSQSIELRFLKGEMDYLFRWLDCRTTRLVQTVCG